MKTFQNFYFILFVTALKYIQVTHELAYYSKSMVWAAEQSSKPTLTSTLVKWQRASLYFWVVGKWLSRWQKLSCHIFRLDEYCTAEAEPHMDVITSASIGQLHCVCEMHCSCWVG